MSNQKISSGYIILNKRKGVSSFFALREVQKKLRDISGGKKVKMGHAGTLDPLAEGLLLCGVEQGTKILSEMILSKKSYTAEIFLGKYSETDDEEGKKFDYIPDTFCSEKNRSDQNISQNIKKIPTREEIEKILEKFLGKIRQTPPVYSALKISGKRACDRVRKNSSDEKIQENIAEAIQKKTREIEIFQIKILDYSFPRLKIFVECGSGTYIRSLARDIGTALHLGAYLTFLRRDSVGSFLLKNAVEIENISFESIQKFSPEMFDLPKIFVSCGERIRLENGQRIRFFEIEQEQKKVLLLEKKTENPDKNEIIGFGEQDGFLLRPRKIFS